MKISANTKISELIKANPKCIDVIASINKHFEKLRNPILRKILASRVTIADAAKIGGCKPADFFDKLTPLGFVVEDSNSTKNEEMNHGKIRPDFIEGLTSENTVTLDVRGDLASGMDPFQKIMSQLRELPPEKILLVVNTFEPTPLINILKKKNYDSYSETRAGNLVHTYFKKNQYSGEGIEEQTGIRKSTSADFEKEVGRYKGKIVYTDVRNMEMPKPMITILHELEVLPTDHALFVNHKKVPQFLFPELAERNYKWVLDEIGEGNVKLLIYK